MGARRRTARWAASSMPSTISEEGPDVGRELLVGGQRGQRVGGADDHDGHDEQAQFGVATTRVPSGSVPGRSVVEWS